MSWPSVSAEPMLWTPSHVDGFEPSIASYLGGPREYEASIPAEIAECHVYLPNSAVTAAEEAGRE